MENHFKDYDNLMEILITNGLKIPEESRDTAKMIIQDRTYYSLINGFKQPFINDVNNFIPATSFEDILFQYDLEQTLKNILLDFVLKVETRYKEIIGHLLGKTYGDTFEKYMDIENFSGKRETVINQINYFAKELHKIVNRNNITPTKYYETKKGFVPPWIFIHDLTFSPANSFFSLLRFPLKRKVVSYMLYDSVSLYEEIDRSAIEIFKFSMAILVVFRNSLAHNSRLYRDKVFTYEKVNYSILTLFIGPDCISKSEFDIGLGDRDLFSFMAFIEVLSSPLDKGRFTDNLISTYDDSYQKNASSTIKYFTSIGLPLDFIARLQTINTIKRN